VIADTGAVDDINCKTGAKEGCDVVCCKEGNSDGIKEGVSDGSIEGRDMQLGQTD
jgi:hypothetical protein